MDFLVASLPTLLGVATPSHVRQGWPRKPLMNMMLNGVSDFAKNVDAIVLHAKLVVVLCAGCQPCEVEPVHGSTGWCHRSWAGRPAQYVHLVSCIESVKDGESIYSRHVKKLKNRSLEAVT